MANLSSIVWETADKFLRSVVEEEDYGDYILPFTVLRRLECQLAPTKKRVLELVKENPEVTPATLDAIIKAELGLTFYNTSALDLPTIAATDDNVKRALLAYIDGFSQSVADIWEHFKFKEKVEDLEKVNRLFQIVNHFAKKVDFDPEKVSNTLMGDIFENIMYRAFDKKGKAAGAFYTPRDAIRLAVEILFATDDEGLRQATAQRSIYDPTAGSCGMLLIANEFLQEMNPGMGVNLFGQESMPSAYALGKADVLIQGGRPESIRFGSTLAQDAYADQTFDYVLSNPPFGTDWKADEAEVKEEAKTAGSRFSHGVTKTSDGQMLFMAHCAHKLRPKGEGTQGGRAAVFSNASPLFDSQAGAPGIRQWLLENDLIDAIIGLPNAMFYGTGINTYIWILDTNKEPHRKGKIQLIDASSFFHPMRKGMGEKRNEITEDDRAAIARIYRDYEEGEFSQIVTPQDLMFIDVEVHRKAHYRTVFDEAQLEVLRKMSTFTETHEQLMRQLEGTPWSDIPANFTKLCQTHGLKTPAASTIDKIMTAMAVSDEDAPVAVNRKGEIQVDNEWKITERIALSEDVTDHMQAEVLPYEPDAIWDETKGKTGSEIPFTRLFYKPAPQRSLEEIDAELKDAMRKLMTLFEEVE